jgi:multidrug efflux pump subunit AcrA (membrane-fusion protein)
MYANTELQLEHKIDVLTIPVTAVIDDDGKQLVLALDRDNRVQRRTIETGIQGSELIEVTSGLSEGDRVIAGGQSKYQAGEKVTPKLKEEKSDEVLRQQSSEAGTQSEPGGGR